MAKRADPEGQLIDAALGLAGEGGWRRLTMHEIAMRAGLSMAQAYKIAADKEGILDLYAQRIDAALAEALIAEPGGETWRDKLFDALMARFDLMLADRDRLRVIAVESRFNPIGRLAALRREVRSMERLLEVLGLSADPLSSKARAAALSLLSSSSFGVWLRDDEDQAKTMADLDRRLGRLERTFRRFARGTPRGAGAGQESEAAVPSGETKH